MVENLYCDIEGRLKEGYRPWCVRCGKFVDILGLRTIERHEQSVGIEGNKAYYSEWENLDGGSVLTEMHHIDITPGPSGENVRCGDIVWKKPRKVKRNGKLSL